MFCCGWHTRALMIELGRVLGRVLAGIFATDVERLCTGLFDGLVAREIASSRSGFFSSLFCLRVSAKGLFVRNHSPLT